MSIEAIFNTMLAIYNDRALPVIYRTDLEEDKSILHNYPDKNFIWVLKEAGTAMIPLGVGVNPVLVTHWLQVYKTAIPFLIQSQTQTVTEVSKEEACRLAEAIPQLNTYNDGLELLEAIESVLDYGKEHSHWGLFTEPTFSSRDLSKWKVFFRESGNATMESFMASAIDKLNKFNSSLVAA